VKTRRLGLSDLNPTLITFGTWGLGGPPFWSAVEEKDAVRTMRKAFDEGITSFDTAPAYGMGQAERLMAKALRDVRHQVIYATKVGLRWKGSTVDDLYRDLSEESVRYELQQSLRRLETDYIDLYQVHWPDTRTSIEETFSTLSELQKEGNIRYIGVSNYTVEMIGEAMKYADVVSLQPRYNLLDLRIEEELQPFCLDSNIGIIPYSPLASGLLTVKYTKESTFDHDWRGSLGDMFKPGVFEKNIELVERFTSLAAEAGCTMTGLAIAWVLAGEGISSAIVGANSIEHVEQNIRAADVTLSEHILESIRSILAETFP